jgi:hypothetical protein
MERLKMWPGWARANRRRAHPRRPALALMQLEQRLTPSVAQGLLNVPMLSWWHDPVGSQGYVETHTLTRSFSHTITLDENGSAASGTYTLDIVGEAHSRDDVSGAGAAAVSSGTLTTDVTYHTVISGRHTPGGDVLDSETYSETGSATETHAVTLTPPTDTVYDDGSETVQWDLSWSAVVAGGALSFTSFSNVHSDDVTWHHHIDAPAGSSDEQIHTGYENTETGSGGSQETYDGHAWWEVHEWWSDRPPFDYTSDTPASGTVDLDTTVQAPPIPWPAEDPAATGFVWHGVTELGGTLTETATFVADDFYRLDVGSFSSTSHALSLAHLIEDEPSVPDSGTGQENYHKDQTYAYSDDTAGGGSYLGNHFAADFHPVEAGSASAHNTLTVSGDQTSGTDEYDGEPYTMLFNYSGESSAHNTTTNRLDYQDGDAGAVLLGESFQYADGGHRDTHYWGVRNGEGFDGTFPDDQPDSEGGLTVPGTATPITPADLYNCYPYENRDSDVFFAMWGDGSMPAPRTTTVMGRAGALQNWYNREVQRIGEQAMAKVANLVTFRQSVMLDIGDHNNRASGRFTVAGKGDTFAIGIGRSKDLDKSVKKWTEVLKGIKCDDGSIRVVSKDVVIDYAVLNPEMNPRSGRCVVGYRINIQFAATRNGRPIPPDRLLFDGIQGNGFFDDDNLKTRDLTR